MIEVDLRAGYGIRTRGLNFGKVACCHYTKPAGILLTTWSIADRGAKVNSLRLSHQWESKRPVLSFEEMIWIQATNLDTIVALSMV